MDIDLNELLRGLLTAHGIEASIDGNRVAARDVRFSGEIVLDNEVRGGRSVQLDVRVELWAGRLLIESFGGLGSTRDAAVEDAVKSFTSSTFHVLLAALFGKADGQVAQHEWILNGRSRTVTVGGVLIRGEMPEPQVAWLQDLEQQIKSIGLPEGTHWIRVYYAQRESKPMGCEVLLDNDDWPQLQARMERIDWPVANDFYSVRVFLMVQGGVDVSQAVGVIAALKGSDDDAIRDRLVSLGASRALADRFVSFIPLAFGRVLLRTMPIRFRDTALVAGATGAIKREIRLQDEAVFAEATRLAQQAATQGTMSRDAFGAVALRSAEVNALNKALHAGAEVENLEPLQPTVFLVEEG